MNNISGSINLASLEHAVRELGKNKTKCIIIPIEANHLMLTDKGNCYVNIQANEHINADNKTTHIVNQSLPKEVYEKYKAENKYAPTLGNLTDWSKLSGGESEPTQSSDIPPMDSDNEDLPF